MSIIGFSFTKISAEKKAPVHGKINVNNNVSIVEVADANLSMAQTKKSVRIRFAYSSRYDPALGMIELQGDVLLLEDAKAAEDMLAQWSKSKALPKQLLPSLLNHVLERCNVQALILARDLGLPSPVPLPKVNIQAGAPTKPVETKAAEKKPKK